MNRTVFFKDGVIMQVQRGNRYLKRQIATYRKYEGRVPYRFSGPYTVQEVDNFHFERRMGVRV